MLAFRLHLTLLLLAACSGCASPGWHFGRKGVDAQLFERTGEGLGPRFACQATLPPGVCIDDGLSEQEAILSALWNNARFQELLVDLEVSRADILQARQLTNPEFWTVFPVAAKQLEFALNVPLEAFWLRPKRVAAAELESRRIGQRLVQDGLNLIRDVRLAYIDWTLATDRWRMAQASARLRIDIAQLADARLQAGDASELDVTTLQLDGLIGSEDARRSKYEIDLARQRLVMQMGLQVLNPCLKQAEPSPLPQGCLELRPLMDDATRCRPDLLAAQAAIDAAAERARLSKLDYLRVIGVLPDANGAGKKGFEAGPGLQFTVPIFNQNQGAIARAGAELHRAEQIYATLRDTIALEVQQAHTRREQAEVETTAWRERLVPMASEVVRKAEAAFREGGAPMLLVLESNRQLLAAQLRQVQAEADLRRAAAELDRAVGRHVMAPQDNEIEPIEELPP